MIEQITEPKETFEDLILICKVCQAKFLFSKGEQQYFRDRALSQPRTCPQHRPSARRRLLKENGITLGQQNMVAPTLPGGKVKDQDG